MQQSRALGIEGILSLKGSRDLRLVGLECTENTDRLGTLTPQSTLQYSLYVHSPSCDRLCSLLLTYTACPGIAG
ncbi:Uncharacterized protein HZ326_20301 [Fusarium oxysporum f. sp. albedinis]|nr:Uncharacterized protein HZ326_20301 [Fusarium oxysporum f. sp. albedinis]